MGARSNKGYEPARDFFLVQLMSYQLDREQVSAANELFQANNSSLVGLCFFSFMLSGIQVGRVA